MLSNCHSVAVKQPPMCLFRIAGFTGQLANAGRNEKQGCREWDT